ncbi:hypothetical protein QAD02_010284 [Eretmocerus hayati]|uniref:Uncharacterized protein n=1 Tax=Eretmocerus hayati TaxID=131215 RepID=A0ACC2ND84_9HYME|nr:hypothetical protein QAD02_010284 [Eretmocerus hayati]
MRSEAILSLEFDLLIAWRWTNYQSPSKMLKFLAFVVVATTSLSVLVVSAPSEKEEKCPAICINTKEWEPICGSDNTTYANSGALKCAQKCEPDLKGVHAGECQQEVTTMDSVPAENTPSEEQGDCNIPCASTDELSPVCGSNGKTYPNPGALECAKKCKPDLQMVRAGPCQEEVTTMGSVPAENTPSEEQDDCDIPCAGTLEFSPVCGSNGKTYPNPSALECAKKCKPDLQMVRAGPCQEEVTTMGSVPAENTPSEEQDDCDIPCAGTFEFSPVCGSNGKTYPNPSALECAKKCKPSIEKASDGLCEEDIKQQE